MYGSARRNAVPSTPTSARSVRFDEPPVSSVTDSPERFATSNTAPPQPDITETTPKQRTVTDEATALMDSLKALGISRNSIQILKTNYEIDQAPMNICMAEADDLRSLAVPMLEVKKIINLSKF